MLHGNGQIDVKLISRLESCGNKVVVYYSRMEGGIERRSSFLSGRQGRIYFDLTTN